MNLSKWTNIKKARGKVITVEWISFNSIISILIILKAKAMIKCQIMTWQSPRLIRDPVEIMSLQWLGRPSTFSKESRIYNIRMIKSLKIMGVNLRTNSFHGLKVATKSDLTSQVPQKSKHKLRKIDREIRKTIAMCINIARVTPN